MPKRIKTSAEPVIITREQMESLVGEIAGLTIVRDKCKALLDARIKRLRDEAESTFVAIDSALGSKLAVARDWATAHRHDFRDKKSLEMVHAIVGWRTGMPKLKPIKGHTWEEVCEHLVAQCLGFVRTIKEVDKEAIIAARDNLGESGLSELKVRVIQDETFFVEPKREPPTPQRQTSAA